MDSSHSPNPLRRGDPAKGEDASPARRGDDEDEEVRIGWRMAGLGFTVASEVAAGTLLGYFIDRWSNTSPVWTTVGAGIGIAVSLYGLIRGALKLNRQLERASPSRPLPPPLPPPLPADEAWDNDTNDSDVRDPSKPAESHRPDAN